MKINLVTVVGAYTETLEQMLRHYRDLGITSLSVHINADSLDDELVARVRKLSSSLEADIASVNVVPWSEAINPILYAMTRSEAPEEWFVLADADEFQVYPDALSDVLDYCNRSGYDFVEGCFVDRIASNGTLKEVDSREDLWNQFPLGGCISGPLLGAVINKIVAAKGYVQVGRGQHHARSGVGCPVSQLYVPVHHFKWTSGLPARLEERIRLYKRLGEGLWRESERFLNYYAAEQRIQIEDERFFLALCEPEYPFWSRLREWRIASSFFRVW